MKILFHIAHPAQYHMFKHTIKNLKNNGHQIKISINTKDVLEDLMIAEGLDYVNILPKRRKKNTKWAALLTLIKKDLKIFSLQWNNNFDMMVGTETALAHIAWLFKKPSLIMDEDDAHVVPSGAGLSFAFAKHIVSPKSCDLGRFTHKKIAYDGYQKIAYLHPDYFIPNKTIVSDARKTDSRYFLIRASGLSAYGDSGSNGFTFEVLRKIIHIIEPLGDVIISSEKELPADLASYSLRANITQIHHFLFYAELLIADSQSMCVEAAILGTPSIRYSAFAGKIGVLEELEHKYDLTYGVPVQNEEYLFKKLEELLLIKDIREKWQLKRKKMLADKIDVTAFWTWLIDTYPSSIKELKENPNYQDRFLSNIK